MEISDGVGRSKFHLRTGQQMGEVTVIGPSAAPEATVKAVDLPPPPVRERRQSGP